MDELKIIKVKQMLNKQYVIYSTFLCSKNVLIGVKPVVMYFHILFPFIFNNIF